MSNKLFRLLLRQNNPVSRYVVDLKRKYRVKKQLKDNRLILEISGGTRPLSEEYLNVDIIDAPEVDILADLNERLPFESASVDKILSIATLEHFGQTTLKKILLEFYRILKPEGLLEIGVPSLQKIIEQYQIHGCTDTVMRYFHGAQKDPNDIHLFVADARRFKQELFAVGFRTVTEENYNYDRHNADYMMKIVAYK